MAQLGRPSNYDPNYVSEVLKMAERGATDVEIADAFDVTVRTLYRWKAEHEDFKQALKIAKDVADERVERSLYQRALGFEHDTVKIFYNAKTGEVKQVKYREKVAPDTVACIFWLKNRKRAEWRDRTDTEHTGSDGGPIDLVVHRISAGD
jgi:transposase-like protein